LTVSLLAEVARNYLELRGLQQRMQIARKNLLSQNTTLELIRSKRKNGLATELDVARATAQSATTASGIPPLEAGARRLIHALSTLVGKEPNDLSAELNQSTPLPVTPPEIPVGLPSQLVERRPDIRASERQIAASSARVGVAQADLFPPFALIGNAGLDATSPGNLLNWESRYFLISPTVSWRIFNAGRIVSNVKLQKAMKDESVLQYCATILKAWQEVEDARAAYAAEQARRHELADAVDNSQLAMNLARQDHDHGLVDFLNVLEAEQNALAAQDALAQSSQSICTDLVAIYKSLGGGWNAAEKTFKPSGR
jgi:outer membrane protein, multidrug efflux system